jgi:polyferredoxin
MTSSFLRKFRIAFSAIILLCFILVFVDFSSLIPEKYINYLVFFQFIPSVIKYIDLKTIAAGGFLGVILLTLLTGRTYCSFLCPLGIGQDLNSRIGGKIKKKFRRFGFQKPFTVIRYSLLVLTFGVALVWGLYLVTILDPYSIFGRFSTFFLKPVVLLANNLLAGILGKFDNYTLHHVPVKGFPLLT